jgi:hypothetical protein
LAAKYSKAKGADAFAKVMGTNAKKAYGIK